MNVEYISRRIDQDIDSIFWTCEIDLINADDAALFPRNTPFSVDFYGRIFNFIAEPRQRNRATTRRSISYAAKVRGVSPLAVLASTRGASISLAPTINRMASDLVSELLQPFPVTWELLDWSIPAYRFAAEGISPLEAAQQIVSAVGGVLICTPEGDPIARKRYPIRIPDYQTIPPRIEVTGDAMYSWSERGGNLERWNCVTVRDTDPGASADRLEFIVDPNNSLAGVVRAYPDPWRTSLRLESSRGGISTGSGSIVTRTVTEKVEFIAGRGSTRYPIFSLSGVDWLDRSLGGLSFEQYGQEFRSGADDEWGYAEISYRVRSINFSVSAREPIDTQFQLEDTGA